MQKMSANLALTVNVLLKAKVKVDQKRLEPAPCFEGQVWYDGMIQNVKLSDYKDKWVVLFFYPFDFTFVCPTEICAFSDASDNFAKINCQIIGASCDSIFVHREFALRERKQGGVAPLKIPLSADNSHEIAKNYGCYIYKGDAKGATSEQLILLILKE